MTSLLLVLAFYYNLLQNKENWTPEIITDFIATESLIMGVNPQMAIGVAHAESRLTTDAVGDHGTSYGLYQIHLPAHLDVSKEMAINPIFATEWSITEMKLNSCKIWTTCEEVLKSIGP